MYHNRLHGRQRCFANTTHPYGHAGAVLDGAEPKKFLIGAGGGSSPLVKGGKGAYGLLISANSIDAGTIDAAGRDGRNDPGQSTAGGGGGGVIVLAYGDGGYTPGSYNIAGGYTVTADGTDQGFGGNGQVLTGEVTPFIFDDGFQGSELSSAWTAIAGPGDPSNSEQECYSPHNTTVTGGMLNQKAEVRSISNCNCPSATQSPDGCGYISGAVQWTSLSFTYGTVSVRAKLAGGKGTWPAIWLLGADCQVRHGSNQVAHGPSRVQTRSILLKFFSPITRM